MRQAGLGTRFVLSSTLNPIYEFGDFDRDGLVNVAVEVKDTGGLRCGIAITMRLTARCGSLVLGRPSALEGTKSHVGAGVSKRGGTSIATVASRLIASTQRMLQGRLAGWYGMGCPTVGFRCIKATPVARSLGAIR